ncbi:hypothetical protein BDW62DRAFT_205940 [Aspergillus aurantiobrunneus]
MAVLPKEDEKTSSVHLEYTQEPTTDDSIEDIAPSWFVWLVALTASTAGGLFGYDTGIISAVLVYLGNDLDGCPTPRQLIYHGKTQQADPIITATCNESKELNKDATRWAKIKLLHTKPAYLRAVVCACGFSVIDQMSGFNTLMYYSATLFDLVGFSDPVAVGLVVAGANFVMTAVNMMAVDPVGRRRIVLLTAWGMAAGPIAIAIAFTFIPVDAATLELETDTVTSPATSS